MKMILKEQFPYSFFITSWWWSCRKGLHICSLLNHDHDLYMETFPSSPWSWFNEKRLWKLFFQDHDHDSMKNIFGNLSIKIMIICSSLNHDHDLERKVSIYALHYIMIMILMERFPNMFFIESWSWSWRKCFHIFLHDSMKNVYGNLSFKSMIMI
jgi:hypothetical protein